MKNKAHLLLITALLIISACRKSETPDDKTYIRGHLLEYGTEAPLANVKIYLNECDGEILGPIVCWKLDSFYTDQNGYFDFEFQHSPTGLYIAAFEHLDNYYPIDNLVINHGLNERNRYADPEAWLEIHVKNITPALNDDELWLAGPWGGGR